MAGATFFEPTPLGVLIAVSKRLEPTDASLSVVCSEALLAFVVRMGLDQILDVAGSREALTSHHHAWAAA